MGAAGPVLRVVRFGVFELDPVAGELRKGGLRIRLPDQSFKILVMLLKHPGVVVTREELRQELWPQGTFVEFDHSLNAAINRLRAVLGDSAENPRFVETLAHRGYRFIGAVDHFPPTVDTQPSSHGSKTTYKRHLEKRYWLAWASGALSVALVGLVIAFAIGRSPHHGEHVPRIQSLAVLPLENLSGDPEQEYFADGVTEDLIADLAQISALRVISRTSVMQYKRVRKPLPQIARELNVDAVVEGVIEHSGDQLRITAQLIYAPTDRHLWAKSYERQLRDVFGLQNEVARNIAEEIRVRLTPQEKLRLTSTRAMDPIAYEAYLKGRYYSSKRTEEALGRSLEYFKQAIEKDPTQALGYAGLADAYIYLAVWDYLPPNRMGPQAKAAALRAVEIDEALAEAHSTLGNVLFRIEWNWPVGEREFRRALELNPSLAVAHRYLAIELGARGDFAAAIAEVKRANELDPLSLIEHYVLGNLFYQARQYDQAIEELRGAIEMDRSAFFLHWSLEMSYAQKRMFTEAIEEAQVSVANSSGSPLTRAGLAHVYAMAGKQAQARRIVERLERESKQRYVPAREVAIVYADLGEKDRAFQWMEKAYQERDRGLIWLKTDPALDSLRSDPRYQDLLRRVGPPP